MKDIKITLPETILKFFPEITGKTSSTGMLLYQKLMVSCLFSASDAYRPLLTLSLVDLLGSNATPQLILSYCTSTRIYALSLLPELDKALIDLFTITYIPLSKSVQCSLRLTDGVLYTESIEI